QHPSCLFFQYNTQLGPPYHILVDTNFINFSIKAKLDLVQSMMDCLYAKCIPCITDCVMAEIEKLGQKYRVALRIAKDPRFDRLPCTHKGTYADDCLVQRVTQILYESFVNISGLLFQHKCYIVATVDRDLKRRIRKIPGVPIMYISNHRSPRGTVAETLQVPEWWQWATGHETMPQVPRQQQAVGTVTTASVGIAITSFGCETLWFLGSMTTFYSRLHFPNLKEGGNSESPRPGPLYLAFVLLSVLLRRRSRLSAVPAFPTAGLAR
ncbi:rRNA-processing protein FCF1-like protein, partial [Microtus ochrogaster]